LCHPCLNVDFFFIIIIIIIIILLIYLFSYMKRINKSAGQGNKALIISLSTTSFHVIFGLPELPPHHNPYTFSPNRSHQKTVSTRED